MRPAAPARYLGNPGGIVLMAKGEKTLIHMGDTGIFSDMALIDEIYQPKIGIVPIGDRFTMGGEAGGDGLQALLPLRDGDPLPLRHVRAARSERPDKFIAEMKGAATKVLVPERGKAVEM